MLEFKVGYGTDVGKKRSQNQDSVAVRPEIGFFIVADGMGGHQGGEIASAMAVEVTTQMIERAKKIPDFSSKSMLIEGIRSASTAIHRKARQSANLNGMGTTVVSLVFSDKNLTVGHVGDSRCYFFRPQMIWQLTRDHSLVQEKLRAGLITREQARTDKMKNVITRSVGFESDVNIDIYEFPIQPGDAFIICSDGLSGMIDDAGISYTIDKFLFEEKDPQKAANELIKKANENGGEDNVTVVVVQVGEKNGKQ